MVQKGEVSQTDPILNSMSHRQCRTVIRELRDHSTPLAIDDLVTHVLESGNATDRRVCRTALTHSHLPRLADVGLIALDRDEDTVRLTDHPAYAKSYFQTILEVEPDGWSEALACFAHARRRVVLTVLSDYGEIELADLACLVATRESRPNRDEQPDAETVAATLYHNHLPRLSDAGLIDYDPSTQRVSTADHEFVSIDPMEFTDAFEGHGALSTPHC